jgi:Ca2+-binding RTX toxin-like protein
MPDSKSVLCRASKSSSRRNFFRELMSGVRLFGTEKRSRKRNVRGLCSFECLEDRKVLTSTLYVDFGDAFTNSTMTMTQNALVAANGPNFGLGTQNISIERFDNVVNVDANGDGLTDFADDRLVRDEIMRVVRRIYEPFNIAVIEMVAATTVIEGGNFEPPTNLAGVQTILNANASAATNRDAYVLVGRGTNGANQDIAILSGVYGQAGENQANSDLQNERNQTDDIAMVFPTHFLNDVQAGQYSAQQLGIAMGNTIAHEAGHTFGLQHTSNGGANQIQSQLARSETIKAGGFNRAWRGEETFFSRNAQQRDVVNSGQAPTYIPYGRLVADPQIGLNLNNTQVVTGTGANDTIVVTVNGNGLATVQVNSFSDIARTQPIGAPQNYTIPANANVIRVYGGAGNDRIEIVNPDLSLTASQIEVFGGSGDDELTSATYSSRLRFRGESGNDILRNTSIAEGGLGDDTLINVETSVFAGWFNLGNDSITPASLLPKLDFRSFNWPVSIDIGSTLAQTVSAGRLGITLTAATIRNVVGSYTATNNIVGNSLDNDLQGGRLNDSLFGGIGNDTINGDLGNDTLTGAGGNDQLIGGSGNDTYRYSNLLLGGATNHGADVITEPANADVDTLDFTNFNEHLVLVLYSTNVQTIGAVSGSKLQLSNNSAIENVIGSSTTTSYIAGNDRDNVIFGGGQTDTLFGRGGNDYLVGNGSNDALDAGGGDDTIEGGAGSDAYNFDPYSLGVFATTFGSDYIIEAPDIDEIDRIYLGGIVGNTVLDLGSTLTQNVIPNMLSLRFSSDRGVENVIGSYGTNQLTGNARNNSLWGSSFNDILIGLGGDDSLRGAEGNDVMTGGIGNDTYRFVFSNGAGWNATGIDQINESPSVDQDVLDFSGIAFGIAVDLSSTATQTIFTSGVNTLALVLSNSLAIEQVTGSPFNDAITGNSLNNILRGNGGVDTIFGMLGNDTIYGGDGDDVIQGGEGNDLIYGDAGIDNIRGNAGNDTIYGLAGNDSLFGDDGDDWLYGGDGDDTIYGNLGADNLFGELGNDLLDAGGNLGDQVTQ